jgi:hypothetical protein
VTTTLHGYSLDRIDRLARVAAATAHGGGERLTAVAADMGASVSALSMLLRGIRTPAPDPVESEAA